VNRFIETHDGRTFDLVVVGGGITGAAVAYDAASRGLSVAMVERRDFGWATSAATSKLIHGGFRYLANLELGLVRESLRERRTLENIAPNLVEPIPVLIPCYRQGATRRTWVLRTGMLLYDALSFDKGSTWDPDQKIGSHRRLTAQEAGQLETVFPREGLRGAFLYHDCASVFPERLTLAFVRSAVERGAQVSNYCAVEGFLFDGPGRSDVAGVKVRDLRTGRRVDLRGRLTVNCTGAWADRLAGLAAGTDAGARIRRSEGIHVVTRPLVSRHMVVLMTSSNRGFFLIPWRGRTLIGTTDKEYAGSPDDYRVTRPAILELLETVNRALRGAGRLDYADVLFAYGGLRPLVGDSTRDVHRTSRKYEIFDHARDGLRGLMTVEGGKYTTSRSLAEKVGRLVVGRLGKGRVDCTTHRQQLAGCEIRNLRSFLASLRREHGDVAAGTVDRLGRYYGTECSRVLDLARRDPDLLAPVNGEGEILAQVVYAIRHEMALTLNDLLLRRTGVGTAGHPGEETIRRVAAAAAREWNWDPDRTEREIAEANAAFRLPE